MSMRRSPGQVAGGSRPPPWLAASFLADQKPGPFLGEPGRAGRTHTPKGPAEPSGLGGPFSPG